MEGGALQSNRAKVAIGAAVALTLLLLMANSSGDRAGTTVGPRTETTAVAGGDHPAGISMAKTAGQGTSDGVGYPVTRADPRCPPRQFYIDGGAHLANTLKLWESLGRRPGPYEVFSFDPGPQFYEVNTETCKYLDRGETPPHWGDIMPHNRALYDCLAKNYDYKGCEGPLEEYMSGVQKAIDKKPGTKEKVEALLARAKCNPADFPLKHSRYTFVPAALADVDEGTQFEFSADNIINGGASVMGINTHALEKKAYDVRLVDLSKFILDNVRPEDWLVVKLDIEGAEYRTIAKLIKTGAAALVDVWRIEFHARFQSLNEYAEREKGIIWALQQYGGIVEGDHG